MRPNRDVWSTIRAADAASTPMNTLKHLALAIYNPVMHFYRRRFLGLSHQRQDAERTRQKWRLIEGELDTPPGSLLDIGCNEGYFALKAAEKGWCAWGIDRLGHTVAYADKKARDRHLSTAYFARGLMSPATAPLRLASRKTQHPVLETSRGWHRYLRPKCSGRSAVFGHARQNIVAKLGQSSIKSSVLAGGFRYIPGVDDHVGDWNHYELSTRHLTERSLDDFCKIDPFNCSEHLVCNRD